MSTKTVVISLMLLALLAAVSGCTWFTGQQAGPPLTVAASPMSGHPSTTDGGLLVTFHCAGGTGTYSLVPGDGSEGVVYDNGTFTYLYTLGGTHAAIVSSGGQSKTVQIDVINQAPQVYPGMIVVSFDWMEKVRLFAEYRLHGCDNGMPLTATGARDLDGDLLTYEWIVMGPDKNGQTVSYTIFDSQRQDITGQRTAESSAWTFLGWVLPDAPYPFGTQSLEPQCDHPPYIPPTPIPGTGTVTITLKAYDPWGGVGEASWTESLTSGGCSSSL